ncbi:MAG: hypothetical protein LBJ16_02560 [Holosporaceae bacterium]|nr:hypothetical protein [Holosporaceae bacterium]
MDIKKGENYMKRGIFALSFMVISCFFPTQGMDRTIAPATAAVFNLDSTKQISAFGATWDTSLSRDENRKKLVDNLFKVCTVAGRENCPLGVTLTDKQLSELKEDVDEIVKAEVGCLLLRVILAKYNAVVGLPKLQLYMSSDGKSAFAFNGKQMVYLRGNAGAYAYVDLKNEKYGIRVGARAEAVYHEICHWFDCVNHGTGYMEGMKKYDLVERYEGASPEQIMVKFRWAGYGRTSQASFENQNIEEDTMRQYCSTDAETLAIHGLQANQSKLDYFTPFNENAYLYETRGILRISYNYSIDNKWCRTMYFARHENWYALGRALVHRLCE